LRSRLGRAENLLLLKKPFESIEVILIAGLLTRKWLLGRQGALKLAQIKCPMIQRNGSLWHLECEEFQRFRLLPSRLTNNQAQSRRELQEPSQKDPPLPLTEHADTQFLRRATETVEKYMSDFEFDVEALSRLLFVSRRQLLRKLTAVAGCAPNALIRKLRLKRAAELLKSSGLTVSEITYAVGFSDLKHFRKVFREQYGISPSDFARKAQEQKRQHAA
jgi:AraC-like DNA-binding protein